MIRADEMVVDNFAGGGGASLGIERALGRPVDLAVNHDPEAVALHRANHPATRHACQNIWRVDPREATDGRPVGLAWFSPDCKHFSKAKSGRPVEKRIRDLAWVVVHWAKLVRPRIICLENVEEFKDWGPLAGNGRPCPANKGREFRRWVRELRHLGYRAEWRELRACDFGAPTIRKRLFLVARRDGAPIVWPEATHGPGRLPFRTAADCIDWSRPCPSIFLTREAGRALGVKRPLAEATMRRIARGVKRYVLDAAAPFIVTYSHGGDWFRGHGVDRPLNTLTAARDHGLVAPFLVPRYGERSGQAPRAASAEAPMATVVPKGNGASLVAAFMAQHNGGMVGHPASAPVSTVSSRGSQQQLVACCLNHQYGSATNGGQGDPERPLKTVTTGGHHALVAVFLAKHYYGEGGQLRAADAPLHTIATRARFGAVTVEIDGTSYAIVDIGMRMLTPRELFRAQGFPDSYEITPAVDGRPLTKTAKKRMVGNSVCPDVAEAVVAVNSNAVIPRRAPEIGRAVRTGELELQHTQ
jgi:DNA (cytosine-5)-methyltransferase 1